MAHPARSSSTTRDLAKVLAAWLAAIVLLQAFTAVHAKVLGPLHLHRAATMDTSPAGVALFSHRHDEHQHLHGGLQRHHHHHGDATVVPVPDAPVDASRGELPASMVLAAVYFLTLPSKDPANLGDRCRHVWSPATPWTASTRFPAPPTHPPRR